MFTSGPEDTRHESLPLFADGWNKDFKPAKFPETDKEREAAARKYGLHPAEYQPYPNDGLGYGDYPKLADTPVEARDPYYPYDFPELKRNLHEPVSDLGESDVGVLPWKSTKC